MYTARPVFFFCWNFFSFNWRNGVDITQRSHTAKENALSLPPPQLIKSASREIYSQVNDHKMTPLYSDPPRRTSCVTAVGIIFPWVPKSQRQEVTLECHGPPGRLRSVMSRVPGRGVIAFIIVFAVHGAWWQMTLRECV